MKTTHSRTARRRGMQLRSSGGASLHEIAYQQAHGCCFYCGTKIDRPRMTLDHMTPLNRGGIHTLENVVMSCRACNSAKDRMTLLEYRIACGGQQFPGEALT